MTISPSSPAENSAAQACDGGPLAGVRVVDLTTILMGPFASQLLGDMGADVVKVESPAGDPVRNIGPMRNPGMGANFLQVNRNKRSVVLDLKSEGGRAALLRLVAVSDVVAYNVRPAAMARLGLSYEELRAVNPRIVYVGMYGYGQDGPYAAMPAYDDLIQGAIAIPSLFDAAGGGGKRYVPVNIVDRTVGLAAAGAVTAALYQRERTQRGQSVEVPMFETMVPFVMGEHLSGQTFEPPIGPYGYGRLLAPDRRPFPTRDGYLGAVIYTDRHWKSFHALAGWSEPWGTDPRMASITTRSACIGDLYREVGEVLKTGTTAHWMRLLNEADIPCMAMHDLESLADDPHLAAVGFFGRYEHPSEGPIVQTRAVPDWPGAGVRADRLAPQLGEHTEEVLRELGYADESLRELHDSGHARFGPRGLRTGAALQDH